MRNLLFSFLHPPTNPTKKLVETTTFDLLILTGHSFDVGQAVSEEGGEQLGGADEEQSREDLSCVEAEMGVFDITCQTPS